MDAEINAAFERVHEKLDAIGDKVADKAERLVKAEGDINGVGQRLNDHIKDHDKIGDKRWAVWLAVIGTAIMGAWEVIKAVAGKKIAP